MSDESIFEQFAKKGSRPGGGRNMMIAAIVVVALFFLMTALKPYVVVNAGERGVVKRFGEVLPDVLDEGIHWLIPGVDVVVIVDVKIQKSETQAVAASSDIQQTRSIIALNYRILPDRANIVIQEIGTEFKSRIIDPAVQEVLKAVAARYTAESLIAKRAQVRDEILDLLKERLLAYNIEVVDFAIIDFQFSEQFSSAIEAKQAAEQMALKAARDLDRIRIEAEQQLTRARAEAEGLRLQKQNVSPDLIRLRQIEATLRAIEKWDGVLPRVTGGAMPFIDVVNVQ
jgi:regulator of protease activity HflC (stomatin/prohibitin superfamily)